MINQGPLFSFEDLHRIAEIEPMFKSLVDDVNKRLTLIGSDVQLNLVNQAYSGAGDCSHLCRLNIHYASPDK